MICYMQFLIVYRSAFFTTEASNTSKADWLREIMNSLGRYLFCNATTSQIQEHLSVKYRQFLLQQNGDEKLVKIAAKNVGLQEIDEEDYAVEELHLRRDAKLWVLNSSVHVTSSGRLVSPEDSPFVWLGNYKNSSNVCTSYKYASAAEPVQPDKDALTAVVQALHVSYLNNFPPASLALGAQLLNLHFQQLLPVMKGVPIAVLYGAAACGKSTAMHTALSFLGTQSSHYIGHCPDVTFFE